jgi:hypothetical protein
VEYSDALSAMKKKEMKIYILDTLFDELHVNSRYDDKMSNDFFWVLLGSRPRVCCLADLFC